MEKVILAEIVLKNDWANLKDNNGREISVFLGTDKSGKASNASLKPLLEKARPGDEIEMDVKAGKDGTKLFGWEPKQAGSGSGGKGYAPKDKIWESALAAANAASNMLALTKDASTAQFDTLFEHIHGQIISKIAK